MARSRHTSGRSFLTPTGDPNRGFVREGNLLSARVAILIHVCAARGLRWLLEQPSGTILAHMPWYQRLWAEVEATIGFVQDIQNPLNYDRCVYGLSIQFQDQKTESCLLVLFQAHRTTFWMGNFGHDTPKQHWVWSNDVGLLEAINGRAGYMSRHDQSTKEVKLVRKYIDKNGQKRHVGIRPELRKSQILMNVWW